jgi:hypothetical protein
MQKRSSSDDVNQLAASIVEQATQTALDGKNPAAVALGKLGGLKGGPARAKKLSAKRRSAIASHAAKAKWRKKKND